MLISREFLNPFVSIERARLLSVKSVNRKILNTADLSRSVLQRLDTLKFHSVNSHSQLMHDLATQFNLGTLTVFRMGEVDVARDLCAHVISIFREMALKHPERRNFWIPFMLQPYINYGRIHTNLGLAHEAIEIYKNVFLFSKGEAELNLGLVLTGSSTSIRPIPLEDSVQNVCRNCYILESIRTLLLSRKYRALLSFLDDGYDDIVDSPAFDGFRESNQLLLSEARVRALVGLNRYSDAIREMHNLYLSLNESPTSSPAALILLPHIYRLIGREDIARRELNTVKLFLEKADPQRRYLRQCWYLLLLELIALGEHGTAQGEASLLCEASLASGDESIYIKTTAMRSGLFGSDPANTDSRDAASNVSSILREAIEATSWKAYQAIGYLMLGLMSHNGPGSASRMDVDRDILAAVRLFKMTRLKELDEVFGLACTFMGPEIDREAEASVATSSAGHRPSAPFSDLTSDLSQQLFSIDAGTITSMLDRNSK